MPITEADGPESRWPPDLSRLPGLSTDRLDLRLHAPDDAAAVCGIARDWDVARWTARIPHPYELKMAEQWIADGVGLRLAGRELALAIVRRADRVMLGGVSLTFGRGPGAAEIGFSLGRSFWGQGYMREAVAGLLTAAFEMLNLDTVWAETMPENARSIAVQEALGFVFVETCQAEAPARGGPITVEMRRLTRRDWFSRAAV